MKRKILISIFILLISIASYLLFGWSGKIKFSGLNAVDVLKINPGMPIEEVCEVLGNPLRVEALHGIHKTGCVKMNPRLDVEILKSTDIRKLVHDFISNQKYCCSGNKEDIDQFDKITLVYTKPGISIISYPMLWIHLDTSFRVRNVFAKKYENGFLGDDPCIYDYGCPFDSIKSEYICNEQDRRINKEKFFDCFK